MKFTATEIEAIEGALPGLGQYVAEKGLAEKSFSEMSREEILGLVAGTVRIFRESYTDIMGDIPF